jgi:hypothetical protein
VKCWVRGCESDGFKFYQLAKQETLFDFPSEVLVCGLHRQELADPNCEWMMVNHSDGSHDLYIGAALRQLNEYVVVKSPTQNKVYSTDARKYSSPNDSGYHFPIQVRQRGKENPETLTLVLSPGKLAEFAKRFQHFAQIVNRD